MFPINPMQSQIVIPISQIGACLSSIRKMYTTSRKLHLKKLKPENCIMEAEKVTNDINESITKELNKLVLHDIAKHVKIESIYNETLNVTTEKDFEISRDIFRLKKGTKLIDEVFSKKPVQTFQLIIPNYVGNQINNFPNIFHRQIRAFKYRPKSRGLGKISADESNTAEILNNLKTSLKDKVLKQNNSKENVQFNNILNLFGNQPQIQEKLKIAFAEGYAANPAGKQQTSETTSLSKILFKFFWYGLLIWIVFQILQGFTVIGGMFDDDMKGLNVLKGERYEVNPEDINVTFNDVMGVDEAKEELKDIVEFLRDPDRFRSLGAKLPKGVLLVGPPGIGKTLLARAVAGEASVPFFHASGSEFDEIFVGTGAKRVRQLFDAAKSRAPCVIFIDEIDTVGAKRTSSQIHPYANQTINQLLSEMDGFQQTEGVIVLGATNRRDNLDKALLRPGRFDVEVRVFPPDLKGRTDIIRHYLKNIKTDGNIDVDKIARGTTGCTGADLENLVNQAALKAAMDSCEAVTMVHMEFSRDKVLMGPAKKTKIPDNDTNVMTAYHEAGHTLVAYYSKYATQINKVTIVPRGTSLGHTSFVPDKEEYNQSKAQLLAQMDVAMGGRVAEELVYGLDKVTTGASSDFHVATNIAKAMVKKFGMSEKVGVRVFDDSDFDSGLNTVRINDVSPATTDLVDSEIKRLLHESYERAKVILKQHNYEHKELATALLKYETLDFDDIKTIIECKGKGLRQLKSNDKIAQTKLSPI